MGLHEYQHGALDDLSTIKNASPLFSYSLECQVTQGLTWEETHVK